MPEIFNAEYAFLYDLYSSRSPRAYECAVKALINVDSGIQNEETVVEIGSGTGNSTIELVLSNPNLGHLFCIEPSDGFRSLATYKFNKGQFKLPPDIPAETEEYIESQKQKASKYSSKVSLLNGSSQNIPLDSAIADRVYCCESLHWFTFPDPKAEADFSYLGKSLSEIHRVLKEDGQLLFDSNGHLFDFQELKIDDRPINDMHFTNHPIFKKFEDYLLEITQPITQINIAKERDRLHFMFNYPLINSTLSLNGFELTTDEPTIASSVTLLPYSNEDIIRSTIHGAKMSYFNQPEMAVFTDEERNDLINRAMKLTLQNEDNLFSKRYYETFVSFHVNKKH